MIAPSAAPAAPLIVNLRDLPAAERRTLPDDVVRIDRMSKLYGNPFKIGHPYPRSVIRARPSLDGRLMDRTAVLIVYRVWLDLHLRLDPAYLEPLRGKRLACWCRPSEGFCGRLLCHAQIVAGRLYGVAPETIE